MTIVRGYELACITKWQATSNNLFLETYKDFNVTVFVPAPVENRSRGAGSNPAMLILLYV